MLAASNKKKWFVIVGSLFFKRSSSFQEIKQRESQLTQQVSEAIVELTSRYIRIHAELQNEEKRLLTNIKVHTEHHFRELNHFKNIMENSRKKTKVHFNYHIYTIQLFAFFLSIITNIKLHVFCICVISWPIFFILSAIRIVLPQSTKKIHSSRLHFLLLSIVLFNWSLVLKITDQIYKLLPLFLEKAKMQRRKTITTSIFFLLSFNFSPYPIWMMWQKSMETHRITEILPHKFIIFN